MSARKKSRKSGKSPKSSTSRGGRASRRNQMEWGCGRFPLPVWIMEPEPYHPHLVLWMDTASRFIIHHDLLHPNASDDELIDSFRKAVGAVGAEPSVLHVPERSFARILRKGLSDRIRIEVGPIPELVEIIELMMSDMEQGEDEQSYLSEGQVRPETISLFFRASARLYGIRPWEIVESDGQILALDAPTLGVEGACLVVIGQLEESRGFILFNSLEDYGAYAEAGNELDETGSFVSPGVPIFSVNFEGAADLPQGMRDEINEHGWELSGPEAYPLILAHDADLVVRPLREKDYTLATALCLALAEFLERHGTIFQEDFPATVSDEIRIEELPGRPAIRITVPHPRLATEE